MKNKTAFTLIELLVVIAIIAILAAILFPVFARAKMAARTSQSVSNVRQLSLAWTLYNGDSDETVMRAWSLGGSKTFYWWGSWDGTSFKAEEGLLFPYSRNHQIAVDPAFEDRLRTSLGFTGYAYNYAYLSPTDYDSNYNEIARPLDSGQISMPSETIAFASAARINNWAYAAPRLEGSALIDPPSYDYPGFHGRNNGVGAVVWCDTHAKTVAPAIRAQDFGYGFQAKDFREANLGDIAKPGCPAGSSCQDWYYQANK